MVRPHVGVVTTDRAGAYRVSSARSAAIADAKGEIFSRPRARRHRGDQPRQRRISSACAPMRHASRGRARRQLRRARGRRRARRAHRPASPSCRSSRRGVLGEPFIYRLGAPGPARGDELARRARRRRALGGDLARAALAPRRPARRRPGAASAPCWPRPAATASPRRRELQRQPGLDARRRSRTSPAIEPGPRGRRIAVLGDMLELGRRDRRCTASSRAAGRSRAASTWSSRPGR